jgi:hypothetical protein
METNLRILYSEAELSTCKAAWEEFQQHPNVDWGFFGLINRTRNLKPCVLELQAGGKTKALWVGRIEERKLPIELGYFKLGSMHVKQLSILNGGIMGDDSEDACRVLMQGALRLLQECKLDYVALSYIPCNHLLYRLATREVSSWLCRDFGVIPNQHWKMILPGSYEEFLKKRSKKHRYWLKRLSRVLEDDFPGQVTMRAFTKPADVSEFCREAESVAKLTYQHQLGSAFSNNEEYQSRCKLLAEQGALRGYIMYVKQQPVAYWFATAYRQTLHLNYTGYDPEFRKYEVGTVLLMKLIEDHCGTSIHDVDFGLGSALYKERFGDETFNEATVRVYRSSANALFANVVIGGSAKFSAGLKALLVKLGLLQKIKTFWRARMSGGK